MLDFRTIGPRTVADSFSAHGTQFRRVPIRWMLILRCGRRHRAELVLLMLLYRTQWWVPAHGSETSVRQESYYRQPYVADVNTAVVCRSGAIFCRILLWESCAGYSRVNIWKITPQPPKKLLQKVFQLILVGFSVLFNILKVYQSRTPEMCFFKMASEDGCRNLLMIVTL